MITLGPGDSCDGEGVGELPVVIQRMVSAAMRCSARTVLAASESVEEAAANLRGEFEDFLAKVAV